MGSTSGREFAGGVLWVSWAKSPDRHGHLRHMWYASVMESSQNREEILMFGVREDAMLSIWFELYWSGKTQRSADVRMAVVAA